MPPPMSSNSPSALSLATQYTTQKKNCRLTPSFQTIPSEIELLENKGISRDIATGVDTAVLAYVASNLLSTSQPPTVEHIEIGGYNSVFKLDFNDGQKLVARIPLKYNRSTSYVESSVATITFARYVLNLSVPRVLTWNAGRDHAICAPFIIMEYVDDATNLRQVWRCADGDVRAKILRQLAQIHATLLAPLPPPLSGTGDLVFAPNLSSGSTLSDPASYMVRPLSPSSWPFSPTSTSISDLWDKLWSYQRGRCMHNSDTGLDREVLELNSDDEDDTKCNVQTIITLAQRVRTFADNAQSLMGQNPTYAYPCLFFKDYAFRNVLINPQTLHVTFIDWDDVHILPFVIALNFTEEMCVKLETFGLDKDAEYYREGEFDEFPPDEDGEIIELDYSTLGLGDEDVDPELEDEVQRVENQNERISWTSWRRQYVESLGKWDSRVNEPKMWIVRRAAIKTHVLLKEGGSMWWRKREWLEREVPSVTPNT